MSHYAHTLQKVLTTLQSTSKGLSAQEAERRLAIYGKNKMQVQKQPLWRIIIEPFANVFMLVLAVAAILSIIHHEPLDASIIAIIMVVNALIFYVQTYSTQKVLRTLEKKTEQQVTLRRGGKEVLIDAEMIVPGDIILLSEGEKIPADGRLISVNQLRVNESQLTGESEPISKHINPVAEDAPIYERANMVYQGSFVIGGSAAFAVTATGNATEFGSIASLVKKDELVSPIQKKIDTLLGQIITVVLAISVVAFGLALLRGMDIIEATRFVLAITVSAVPESLPIAISVVLVLGMRRMAAKKALVQTMRSIETIGALTTIATDKTGTLTYNRLRLEDTWQPEGATNNLAELAEKTISLGEQTLSDPLDKAIDTYAREQGIQRSTHPPMVSFAFNQELAMSGTLWHDGTVYSLHVKGAPEYILQRSKLTKSQTTACMKALTSLTERGYRVIAIAHAPISQPFHDLTEMPASLALQFDGFIAVVDQIRPEAKAAIQTAQAAGVSVRMITGDHLETAFFIGKKLGMVTQRSEIFDARNMDTLTDEELDATLQHAKVFARVIPEQKYRLLTILKKHHITAMTGDGVNDVPALSSAHVGLAMGSGSHIAKDAGDIILLDDNFKTIIDALKEGRTIISNVRRMLFYLLSTNAGEMITMIISLAVGLPIPLVPVQILWVNLVTDSCMVIPLGLEPHEKNVLQHKPLPPTAPILSRPMIVRMLLISLTMAGLSIGGFIYFSNLHNTEYARAVAFHMLIITQLATAFAARSDYSSAFSRLQIWSPTFYIGLAIAAILHLGALFTPLGTFLHIVPMYMADMLITGMLAFVVPIAVSELHKLYCRRTIKAS